MKVSWHRLGVFIRIGATACLGTIVMFPFCWLFPGSIWIALVTAICSAVAGGCAILCASLYLLHLIGWLVIACPLCTEAGALITKGRYTHLQCSQCGRVDAKGFLNVRYEIAQHHKRTAKS